LDLLEAFFLSKGSRYSDFFQLFITNSFGQNRIISFSSETQSNSEEEIIKNCFEYNFNDYCFFVSKNENSIIETFFPHNICIIDNVLKPNRDWIILNILSGNTIELDHSNFPNQTSIVDFISLIPLLSKKENRIEIIDSYFNTGDHNLVYKYLKSTKSKTVCYSRIANGENKDLKRKLIKDYFGKRKTTVLFSKDSKITHERKINIGNLVVEFTHDLAEIKPQNKNWTIYMKICDFKTQLFKANIEKYQAG
jgi:hypothetical protein